MNQKEENALNPYEWKVMKVVWQLKSCVARDVYKIMSEKYGWAHGTTKSTLHRLVKNGHLKVKQVANCYVYSPAGSPLKALYQDADVLMEKAINGTAGPLFLHMIKKGNLSRAEVRELRSFLDELEKKKDIGKE